MASKTSTGGKSTAAKRRTATSKAATSKGTSARSATARARAAAADQAGPGEDGEPVEITGRVVTGMPRYETGADDETDAGEAEGGGYYRSDREGVEIEVDPALSFTSSKKDREAEGVGQEYPFTIDGEVYIASRPPDDVFVLMTTAAASSTPMGDRVAAILEFLIEVVDEQDFQRLRARLKDRNDDFSFVDLLDVMQAVVKRFSKKNRGPQQARAMARAPRR